MDGAGMQENMEIRILEIRGQRVMLDADLAKLYGVSTKRLNEQVQRNRRRFPSDFLFRLSADEFCLLRSQFATTTWMKRRNPPRAFSEHGAVMLASVLNSPQAIDASVAVVRAFVRLRHRLVEESRLSNRVDQLEKKYDGQFRVVFEALDQLLAPPEQTARRIGFETEPGE